MRSASTSRLPRRRYLGFALFTVLLSIGLGVVALLAADVHLHKKYEKTASVNIWGYRGPTVGRKGSGEVRVAVLGGSAAFGYGPDWDGSFPYLLERRLHERGGRFSVVNLAFNNESAYSFRFTLEDYEYLGADITILYEGYNDLAEAPRYQVFRRASPIFRLTGYLPVFPVVFREKAWAMLYGGDITKGYHDTEGNKTVFTAGLATQATAKALETAAMTAESLERQLGRLTRDLSDEHIVTATNGCRDQWQHYCGAVYDAITWARSHEKAVIVATQPYISDRHIDQQNALTGLLNQRFTSDGFVRHVNLGRAVDLTDRSLAYDGMHLTKAGNQIIADALVNPVLELAATLEKR